MKRIKKIVSIATCSLLAVAAAASLSACGSKYPSVKLCSDNTAYDKCITLGDYEGLLLGTFEPITQDDVANATSTSEDITDINYEIKDSDLVTIMYDGRIDGDTFENGTGEAEITAKTDANATEADNSFENAVIGMHIDDTAIVKIVNDDEESNNYEKTEVYEVTILSVRAQTFLTGDEYDTAVQNLKDTWVTSQKQAKGTTAWNNLASSTTVKQIPKSMYNNYAEKYEENCKEKVESGELEDYLSKNYLSEDDYEEAKDAYAISQSKQEMMVSLLADKFEISTDSEEYEAEVETLVEELGLNNKTELTEQYESALLDRTIKFRLICYKLGELGKFSNEDEITTEISATTEEETDAETAAEETTVEETTAEEINVIDIETTAEEETIEADTDIVTEVETESGNADAFSNQETETSEEE